MSDLHERVEQLLASYDPQTTTSAEFLAAQFDQGLAWVHFPEGKGGLGLARGRQLEVDALLDAAGAPRPDLGRNSIGLGMAAPTILAFGSEEMQQRYLRPLFAGTEVWCQLFSEPGAGSDLAAVATRAVRDGDDWVVDGQKVWTSGAHNADLAILLARTDTSVPKHAGMTYFILDMTEPGVDVRPLRQITGEAEFNEVFLSGVRVPDSNRVGDVGQGWKVATTTLNNERVAIGAGNVREAGQIGLVARRWREDVSVRTPGHHAELMQWWVDTEVTRLAGERLSQSLEAGQPGPETSAMKLAFAHQAQQVSGFALEVAPEDGLTYHDWTMVRPEGGSFLGHGPGYRYLRAKGNSIEGGTSEIMRNVIAERVLGLPADHRPDKGIAFKDVPR
ncbi:alkylation response protein AidB-like acyl-CoA dehydrogenase [Dietzia kunjamensis]|jgi:alkylation response protein AidB-like acyl-CoA dehydrogenase|uniref:Acyl-CoA dehydrogenase family protein n=6 Tax=Dietzia TaxID=37914 RepID=A0ABV3YG79_9ACTN|nr:MULTISPECIES: acyl-CoA dehydrogenase family protein [Dietzia]KZO58687.1 acyl-CoA dehydrogenase [Dietzia maris]MVZ91269.1 acyl-CoA dehydrogenase [Microbacter sp. ANSKLAB05]MBB1011229.1 acyl-CoA dehydrogenase [Dietzia kunjamensis]MCT2140374.1 acyl-CoA dehydrogenase family protein [Dietzia cinnamea]MCT2144785.1 acyl-CoA dehydrogenase family protein [Dietzia cinnamea]